MKYLKYRWLFLLFAVAVVLSGCVKSEEVEVKNEVEDRVQVEDESAVEKSEMPMRAPFIPGWQAELEDVTGGSASGSVDAGMYEGEYVLRATFRDLPELDEGYFYEGWVVSGRVIRNPCTLPSPLSTHLSVPPIPSAAALALLGSGQLVAQAGDSQLDGQPSEQCELVRSEPRHGGALVVVDGAG